MRSICAVAAVGLALCAQAGAAALNLVQANPDTMSSFVVVDYVAGTHAFTASGVATTLTLGQGNQTAYDLVDDTFHLTATINANGTATAGTFSLIGTVGASSTNLVTSNTLSRFGFSGAGLFEFDFLAGAGSTLASPGTHIGVILSDVSVRPTFNPNAAQPFAASFSDAVGDGVADTFAVPEPASATALLAVGALLARRRRN